MAAYKYTYDNEEVEYKERKLNTDRNIWKFLILRVLTLGIYEIVFFIPFAFDLDKVAPKRDRSKTMNYLWAAILSAFTMSIVLSVWHYHVAERVEQALAERKIKYDFGTNDFWGWFFFGSLILVGPFIYYYKLCKAMNLICEDYNQKLEQA